MKARDHQSMIFIDILDEYEYCGTPIVYIDTAERHEFVKDHPVEIGNAFRQLWGHTAFLCKERYKEIADKRYHNNQIAKFARMQFDFTGLYCIGDVVNFHHANFDRPNLRLDIPVSGGLSTHDLHYIIQNEFFTKRELDKNLDNLDHGCRVYAFDICEYLKVGYIIAPLSEDIKHEIQLTYDMNSI